MKKDDKKALLLNRALPETVRLARRVEKDRLARFGLTPTQFFTMIMLADNRDCMMKEIGEELALSMGAITGIVDRLAELELVERITVKSDRRVVRARLTEKGKKLLDRVQRDQVEYFSEIIAEIKADDVEVFLDVLNTLVHSLAVKVHEGAV